MNQETIGQRFDKFEHLYLQRDGLQRPSDLQAFILLNALVPSTKNIVAGQSHDEIWLSTDVEDLNNAASDDQIELLVRLGVRYDSEYNALCMFV